MNAQDLFKGICFKGYDKEFKDALLIEKKEHPELSDITLAHIVSDHLSKDPEYYDDQESEPDDDENIDQDKDDADDMVNKFKSLNSKERSND